MGSYDYPPCRLDAAVEAAAEMIRIRAERDPRDEVGIVTFHDDAQVLAGLTCLREGRGHLVETMKGLQPYDGTDIGAGLCAAGGLLASCISVLCNRIVLLTDGYGGDPVGVASELKGSGVVIDVIGIGGSPAAVNEQLLRQVASTVDGELRYRFIADRAELFEHFRRLADKLVK
jgi:Mg-chelatase subunit ChlD